MKTYKEESKMLLDKWYEKETKILEEYKDEDEKYYQMNPQILDGKSPSKIESDKNKQWFLKELKKLKKKYNVGTKN